MHNFIYESLKKLRGPIDPTFDFEMICNELELISTVSDPNDLFGYEWFLQNELLLRVQLQEGVQ